MLYSTSSHRLWRHPRAPRLAGGAGGPGALRLRLLPVGHGPLRPGGGPEPGGRGGAARPGVDL